MTTTYTFDEVARHNNATDLWIVIHNVVYNVTTFLKEHPGGESMLLSVAGQDATERFEGNGHSHDAVILRENYKIGQLAEGEVAKTNFGESKTTNKEIKEPMEEEQKLDYQKGEVQARNMTMFLCVVVAFYAIIFYWFNIV
ncbi:cytochrome b5 [Monomorium pharaonis]|uniref:cytochrome b5 n=1 Tax=Monomorium pharaonis TaxID=307658 RepID=UPI00063F20FD|nr:cytochrome b5 [Monomorium pharaonis]